MATAHNSITDPNIHEPKGIASASDGQVYVADGIGGGEWKKRPHSAFYYNNIGTGTTLTAPTSYTKIGPATTGDAAPSGFTHSGTGRLTYNASFDADVNVQVAVVAKHSAGAGVDCYFAVHKNGALQSRLEAVRTADSANYGSIVLVGHLEGLTSGDYIEVFAKCASGNIIVHALSLTVTGLF